MIAGSICFVASLGVIFGASFMATVIYFTRQIHVEQPTQTQIEEPEQPESELRFVPAVEIKNMTSDDVF